SQLRQGPAIALPHLPSRFALLSTRRSPPIGVHGQRLINQDREPELPYLSGRSSSASSTSTSRGASSSSRGSSSSIQSVPPAHRALEIKNVNLRVSRTSKGVRRRATRGAGAVAARGADGDVVGAAEAVRAWLGGEGPGRGGVDEGREGVGAERDGCVVVGAGEVRVCCVAHGWMVCVWVPVMWGCLGLFGVDGDGDADSFLVD
ncbi:uncharacterized protein K452DRAFT_330661, partial [Aplosporella prunicola CBS 121167]